jgi:ketosteroid isomerase-like protein
MKTLVLLLLTLGSPLFVGAQSSAIQDERQAQQTVVQFFKALSTRDSTAMRSFCTNDAVLFEYGAKWTLDTLIDRVIIKNQVNDFVRTDSLAFVNTKIHENTAWATYNLHSIIESQGKQRRLHWIETVVLVRIQNRWKITLLHSALLKRS